MKYLGGIMKKYLMTLCLAILFTNSLSAFEVYGLKSGMTKDEFKVATNCTADIAEYNKEAETNRYRDARDENYCLEAPKSLSYWKGIKPSVSTEWTHDDKLWRVGLTYVVPEKGILQKIAFRQAVEEANRGIDIQEDSYTYSSSTTNYLIAVYIDNKLSDVSVKHYKDEYLEQF